jgi:dTDP-4-dehydrorhamnose reductase
MESTEAPIAVLGAGGQLGRALTAQLGARCVPLTRADLDITDPEATAAALERIGPSVLINAAAYTAVDKAETEVEEAFRSNGEAPGALARWCVQRDIPFVHYSTDYVFSGEGERAWTESDPVSPINAYGRSKLEGERQVGAAGGRWLILRTSWVYDATARNFLTTMLRLGEEREALSVVDDQWGAPTYAGDLATATLSILDRAQGETRFSSGVYHACNGGETTWYRFASAIFELAKSTGHPLRLRALSPISTSEYPSPARRPLNSRLNMEKLTKTFAVALPDWRAGLAACMQQRRTVPHSS